MIDRSPSYVFSSALPQARRSLFYKSSQYLKVTRGGKAGIIPDSTKATALELNFKLTLWDVKHEKCM